MKDLKNMTITELETLKAQIDREIKNKSDLRIRELWGNVIASINKFIGVTGQDVKVWYGRNDSSYFDLDINRPGVIQPRKFAPVSKIYVVTTGTSSGDDISVHRVYSTLDRAKIAKDSLEQLYPGLGVWIDDFIVDDDIE